MRGAFRARFDAGLPELQNPSTGAIARKCLPSQGEVAECRRQTRRTTNSTHYRCEIVFRNRTLVCTITRTVWGRHGFLAQCDRLSASDTLKQMCQPLDEPIR